MELVNLSGKLLNFQKGLKKLKYQADMDHLIFTCSEMAYGYYTPLTHSLRNQICLVTKFIGSIFLEKEKAINQPSQRFLHR